MVLIENPLKKGSIDWHFCEWNSGLIWCRISNFNVLYICCGTQEETLVFFIICFPRPRKRRKQISRKEEKVVNSREIVSFPVCLLGFTAFSSLPVQFSRFLSLLSLVKKRKFSSGTYMPTVNNEQIRGVGFPHSFSSLFFLQAVPQLESSAAFY